MADEVKNKMERAVTLSENPDAASVSEDRTHYDDETPTEPRWYVVHTYSGYENKVKEDLEKTIENRNLQDQILDVQVPMMTEFELKNGEKRQVQRKIFPGYVLLHMCMNDDTWYVVRNTRGVTGFVGPGSKPVPLSEEEVAKLGMYPPDTAVPFEVGDMVRVIAGPWADTVSDIKSINSGKQRITINVEMFGRETAVELSFTDVKKL